MLKPVAQQMVPFSQFSGDLASGDLPAFIYIAPDQTHNMHDCEDGTRACDKPFARAVLMYSCPRTSSMPVRV